MKKKKLNLNFNKEIVSNLEMKSVKGGIVSVDSPCNSKNICPPSVIICACKQTGSCPPESIEVCQITVDKACKTYNAECFCTGPMSTKA